MLCDEKSAVFQKIGEIVEKGGEYNELTGDNEAYQRFLREYPVDSLKDLNLEQYCLGMGSSENNFSWWIERGLEKALGRYTPGTSRGHILYYKKDGTTYIAKKLKPLSADGALQYVLKLHAIIATTDSNDIEWVDDDAEVARRAGVEPIQPLASGRKLRVLSVYHPDKLLPIQSVSHIRHFLLNLGVPPESIPHKKKPVQRMLLLRECYEAIRNRFNPDLTPYGFIRALYSGELGIRPKRDRVELDIENEEDIQYTAVTDPEMETAVNQILYGPPGTGKTFTTTGLAVKVADSAWYEEQYNELDWDEFYVQVKRRYDQLVEKGRIVFTTFHQSFSYEDFVEGIRAESNEDTKRLEYNVKPGVFKEMVEAAGMATGVGANLGVSASPKVWKISIDNAGSSTIRERCFANGEARIGWNRTGDLSIPLGERNPDEQDYWNGLSGTDHNSLMSFSEEVEIGDILLCLRTNTTIQAVGVVESDYFYEPAKNNYAHVRKVKWLFTDLDLNIVDINGGKKLTLKTLYPLRRIRWDDVIELLAGAGFSLDVEESQRPNYVLIIDEINRGNISRIFGELITLLEPDKRRGGSDERSVVLPYSKETFSVPENLCVIGTMNTADRSLAQIDIALRRRFNFIETPPRPELLKGVIAHGVDMSELLDTINQRIEVLLDHDHQIGHAYLFPLLMIDNDPERSERLGEIFKNNIIPLLQEYFFDDWERVRWVLNDHRKKNPEHQFVQVGVGSQLEKLFGNDISDQLAKRRYSVNIDAYSEPAAYQGILSLSGS